MVGNNNEVQRFKRGRLYHLKYKVSSQTYEDVLLFRERTIENYRFFVVASNHCPAWFKRKTTSIPVEIINQYEIYHVKPDELLLFSGFTYKSSRWDSFFMETPTTKRHRRANKSWKACRDF